MKRIILFLAIVFSVSTFVSAQQTVKLPCGDSLIVKAEPIIGNDITVEPVQKEKPQIGRERRRNYSPQASVNQTNSHNTHVTINANQNHYHYDTPSNKGVSSGSTFWHYSDPLVFLILLLIVGAILLAIYLHNRQNQQPATPAPTPTTVNVYPNNHQPSASVSSERRKPVQPAVDLLKVHENLKGTGATWTIFADGGMKVEYPKPSAEKKEEKPA